MSNVEVQVISWHAEEGTGSQPGGEAPSAQLPAVVSADVKRSGPAPIADPFQHLTPSLHRLCFAFFGVKEWCQLSCVSKSWLSTVDSLPSWSCLAQFSAAIDRFLTAGLVSDRLHSIMQALSTPDLSWWHGGRRVTPRKLLGLWIHCSDLAPAYRFHRHYPDADVIIKGEFELSPNVVSQSSSVVVEGRRSPGPEGKSIVIDLSGETPVVNQLSCLELPVVMAPPHCQVLYPRLTAPANDDNKRFSNNLLHVGTSMLCGVALVLTALLAGVKLDGYAASIPWIAVLSPLPLWLLTATCVVAVYLARLGHKWTFAKAAVLVSVALLLVSWLTLSLWLDGFIGGKLGQALGPVWALTAWVALVGLITAFSFTRQRLREENRRLTCTDLVAAAFIALGVWLLVFPLFLSAALSAARVDDGFDQTWNWIMVVLMVYTCASSMLVTKRLEDLRAPIEQRERKYDRLQQWTIDNAHVRGNCCLLSAALSMGFVAQLLLLARVDGRNTLPWLAALAPLMLLGVLLAVFGVYATRGSRTGPNLVYTADSLPEARVLDAFIDWPRCCRCGTVSQLFYRDRAQLRSGC